MRLPHTIFSLIPILALSLFAAARPALADEPEELQNPPPPGPMVEMKLPVPAEKTLPNGLRVIVVERPGLPLLSAGLVIRNGGEVDPTRASGAMQMLSTLLMRGAGKRTAPQMAQSIEALGATMETTAGWDASTALLTIMSSRAPAGLQLLSDAVRRPTLATDEVERLRAETLDTLRVKMEEPGTVARAAFARLVFGSGPYGHPLSGTPESVERITRDELRHLHSTYFRPDNACLIFAGNLTAAQGFEWAAKYFGDWKNPATPIPPVAAPAASGPARTVVIDMPHAGQAAVVVGKETISRTAPDYYRGLVANLVLGGNYGARLNQEIRVKRGLSYGAFSELGAWRRSGCLMAVAQTKNSAGPEVAALTLTELGRLGADPVPVAELTARTSTLTGSYGRSLETNDGFVNRLAGWVALGVPLSTLQSYPAEVRAVTPDVIQSFARKHFSAAATCVVIAGDVQSCRDALGETFKDAVIIPQQELDLDSLNLRRAEKR
jgi:zinc protease